MHMEDLPLPIRGVGCVSIASAIVTVIRHHNHLVHVVMQGESHVVERFHILVQGWAAPLHKSHEGFIS